MSNLPYHTYPNVGDWARTHLNYSQAVRVGSQIHISGQGGWDPDAATPEIRESVVEEIAQAFSNVELALKTAGGKGWEQVYSVRSYHSEITDESTSAMVEGFKKYMPNHMPIWTMVGVKQLGLPTMHVEIEVVAVVE